MTNAHTRETLLAFEQKVAAAFERKEVRGPIHLCSTGQAEPLIDIFKDVRPEDWVFSTWRSHWHSLLKGVTEDELYAAIIAGRSMYFCSVRQRIVCSAIVGGILPIALGVAMAIKRQSGKNRVHVFIGDMTARTGLYHEFYQYARGHNLPIRVVIEDNGVSTNAVTEETWGLSVNPLPVIRYTYVRNRPHTGTGKYVTF